MADILFEQLESAGVSADPSNPADALWLAQFIKAKPSKPLIETEKRDEKQPSSTGSAATGASGENRREDPGTDSGEAEPTRPSESGVYAESSSSIGDRTVPATPIRIPAAVALARALDLARALRPLNTRLPSHRYFELDEDGTVEQAARHGNLLSPKLRPRPERWFQAALVAEQSPSMDVWGQTVTEFHKLLTRQGAFSDVRLWRFQPHLGGDLIGESGVRKPVKSLLDPTGRRLIFYITNGLAPHWRSGEVGQILAMWGRKSPLVIVHALPPELWKRTMLGDPHATVWSLKPASANHALEWSSELPPGPNDTRFLAPVMDLTPEMFGGWARMLMAHGGSQAPAFLVRTKAPVGRPSREKSGIASTPRQRLQALDHSSPEAGQLAAHMAAAPLTLPVIRLIHAALFGDKALASQIAEVMLSGLVQRVTPLTPPVPPDTVQYRFDPELRPILLERLRKSSALSIVELLSPYIRDHQGRLVDFRALVRDTRGKFELPESAQPFAELVVGILDTFGSSPGPSPKPSLKPPVLRGHTSVVNDIAITPDGLTAISASDDGTVRRWDLRTGTETTQKQYANPVIAIALSDDGRTLVSASGTDVFAQIHDRPAVLRLQNSFQVTALAIDARQNAIIGYRDGSVFDWAIAALKADLLTTFSSPIVSATTTSDGTTFAVATADLVTIFTPNKTTEIRPKGHVREIWLDRQKGRWIAVARDLDVLDFFATDSGEPTSSINGISEAITFTPDGRFLVGIRGENEITLWNMQDLSLLRTFRGHQFQANAVAITPDGSTIVSGGVDKTVRVWIVPPPEPVAGRVALVFQEPDPNAARWMIDSLERAGHSVLHSIGDYAQIVEQSDAIIFVAPALPKPQLLASLRRTGKPLLQLVGETPSERELVDGAAKLIAQAREAGPLTGLPDLPIHFFARPELENALINLLISPENYIVYVEGPGRATLLNAAVRDTAVRARFVGGVIWTDTLEFDYRQAPTSRLYCGLRTILPHDIEMSVPLFPDSKIATFVRPQNTVLGSHFFSVPPLTREECDRFLSSGEGWRESANFDLLYEIHEASWPMLTRIDALAVVCDPALLVSMLLDRATMLLSVPVEERVDRLLDPAKHALSEQNREFLTLLAMCFGSRVPRILVSHFEAKFASPLTANLIAAGFLKEDPNGGLLTDGIPPSLRVEGTPQFHREVVDAYMAELGDRRPEEAPDDGYFFQNFLKHRSGAQYEEQDDLAANPAWQEKVAEVLREKIIPSKNPRLVPAQLSLVIERRSYQALLEWLYERRSEPGVNSVYWDMLNTIRNENESWEDFIGRATAKVS